MAKTLNVNNSKEIIALDIFEAVRMRSNMYIGQVSPTEEKLPLIINNKLIYQQKTWSEGFFHLLVEIFENALDEAKRCKGKMPYIHINVNVDTNEIIVTDTGQGFYNAEKIHKKTGKNVVRTAMEELHAGSNFIDSSLNILGTHGVGSAVTNILSSKFSIKTVNSTHSVFIEWEDYKVIKEEIKKKKPSETLGTTIKFIPSQEVFKDYRWDLEILNSYLSYKKFLCKQDAILNNLDIKLFITKDSNTFESNINENIIPNEHISVKTTFGSIYLWKSYENSCSISFVNGSQCVGIHQKIVNDWANEYFKYNLAHHFYETLIVLNVPSNLMRFNDQNKTKYGLTRIEIEDELKIHFYNKFIKQLSKSPISESIIKDIEDRLANENIAKIKKAQKQSKRKISDKYSPPSKRKKNLFLVEGLCLDENTKIFVIRKNKILSCKLKDVKINDLVLTHNNRFKPIKYKNRSIKSSIQIQTSIGNVTCSENHKWFIYDKISNKFYFEETKNIDKSKHQLVKNYLAFLESFFEVEEIKQLNDKIYIRNKEEEWYISKTDKIAVYDVKNNNFSMIPVTDLQPSNLIARIYINR